MKNILHIISKSSYDGAAITAYRLAKNLTDNSHTILSCYRGDAFEEFSKSGILCENLYESLQGKIFKKTIIYIKFIKHLLKNKYDIIHYHQGGILFLFFFNSIWKKSKSYISHSFRKLNWR